MRYEIFRYEEFRNRMGVCLRIVSQPITYSLSIIVDKNWLYLSIIVDKYSYLWLAIYNAYDS